MRTSNIPRPLIPALLPYLILALALTGCGGSKVLKEPIQFVPQAALAETSDDGLDASLEWVIVRDGPGTWAKNADWDEYLISVHNRSDSTLTITSARIVDSLDTVIGADDNRKRLVKESRKTTKRYKGQGVKVKAGVSGAALAVAGTAATVAAAGVGSAVMLTSSTVAAGAAGALLIGPALAVGGIVKGANNGKVAREIAARHTDLPLAVEAGDARMLDLFFALGPSPQRVELTYVDDEGEHVLVIDTREALLGLHIPDQAARAAAE